MGRVLFTSESVTEGHPDKLADQISDAVLDAIIAQDPNARVACETVLTTGMILLAGEVTTSCYVDMAKIARNVVREVGYTDAASGFDADTCAVLTAIDEQSPDIARGVDQALEDERELGAGDQGLVFGFACDETPELMPLPIALAHALARRLALVRHQGEIPYLWPDGKSQVSIEYSNGVPSRVDTVVLSSQHRPEVSQEELRVALLERVIRPSLPPELWDDRTKVLINPTGRFVIGGPHGDTGLTGRKIIVDTYGGYARHGGGCFSGKDPTKVDRSGAYAARHVAKAIVAAGLARRAELQVAYAIGVARPVSILVNTFGTGVIPDEELERIVSDHFDLRPRAIIQSLDLRRPLYRQTAAYGHFGRNDLDLPWERTDLAETLRRSAGTLGS